MASLATSIERPKVAGVGGVVTLATDSLVTMVL